VHQVGPSGLGKACGSSELVKPHTPSKGRPSCSNKWLGCLALGSHPSPGPGRVGVLFPRRLAGSSLGDGHRDGPRSWRHA
jgi:hypothetical protein